MTLLESMILGLVQGCAEFLPISSSGHLVLLERLFGLATSHSVTVTVVLHGATLLAVAVYFRRELMKAARDVNMLALLVVGTVPAAVVGVSLEDRVESLFSAPLYVGLGFLWTGIVLAVVWMRERRGGNPERTEISWRVALLVGCAQAVAVVPGVSRSGMTIAASLLCGVALREAVVFSFLLSVPVIAGGVVLKLPDVVRLGSREGILVLACGFIVAAISGTAAVAVVARAVISRRFGWFAPYCLVLGMAVVVMAV